MQYKHCETGGDCVGGIDFPEELATFPAGFSIDFLPAITNNFTISAGFPIDFWEAIRENWK